MDADIKALENEVAKINPPLPPPTVPRPNAPSTITLPAPTVGPAPAPSTYGPSRGPSGAAKPGFHPYGAPPVPATAAILQRQQIARSAIAQAQVQAVRLRAQAAAITAARTRTLMSAAAQAQAARAAAIARANNAHNTYSGAPSRSTSSRRNETEALSVGPSYTKNSGSSYHKLKAMPYHKRYDYGYDKKTTTTIPNSSLRGHLHDVDLQSGKPPKRKRLKATHQYQLRTAANEQWVDPTMTDWPENDFRIFCGDLGNEVSDAMLTSAFSKYPSFAKAKVVRDKRTGKSKGYGFVSFLEPHDFIRAFKEMNGKYVGNRPIKLRKSKWKERMKRVKNFKIRP